MKILMILSEVGYHWDEALIPFNAWCSIGWEVTIATPLGKVPRADPNSLVVRPLRQLVGFGTSQSRAPTHASSRAFLQAIILPASVGSINAELYDAIYLVGGHGCLFDLHDNAALNALLKSMASEKKTIAAICHATSILAELAGVDDSVLLRENQMTGFPNLLEHFLLMVGWVDKSFLPLPVWTGRSLDANVVRPWGLRIGELLNLAQTVVSGTIITGVGPKAATALAGAVVAQLSKSKAQTI